MLKSIFVQITVQLVVVCVYMFYLNILRLQFIFFNISFAVGYINAYTFSVFYVV